MNTSNENQNISSNIDQNHVYLVWNVEPEVGDGGDTDREQLLDEPETLLRVRHRRGEDRGPGTASGLQRNRHLDLKIFGFSVCRRKFKI